MRDPQAARRVETPIRLKRQRRVSLSADADLSKRHAGVLLLCLKQSHFDGLRVKWKTMGGATNGIKTRTVFHVFIDVETQETVASPIRKARTAGNHALR